jgi:tetratricopeptide (TPR) repeat protein
MLRGATLSRDDRRNHVGVLVSRRPRALVLITLVVVISALLGVISNIATGLLSDSWRIAPWMVWTMFAILVLASIGLALWQANLDAGQQPEAGKQRGVTLPERPVPAQLPPDVPEFTGRSVEVARLRGQLGSTNGLHGGRGRAVAISAIAGKPGIGKSALAIHLAHEVAPAFPDGQLYANLRGAERQGLDPAVVLGQFLHALRLPDEDIPTELDEQVARYRTLLASRRMLVVLDNAADATQVRPLLPGSATCAVLITSRNPLTALEGANPLSLEFLDRQAAVELLDKLTGRARVAAEPQAADAIAGYCGDLPLALRIAGARLAARPAWPLAALAERLADERRRLTELRAGDLEVRASFELAYTGLAPDDARTFRLLGLLDGPDYTAEVVATLAGGLPDDAEEILERLADAQLLETPQARRYQLHDLLRLFARERLAAEEPERQRTAALERALGWYLERGRQATWYLRPARPATPAAASPFTSHAEALAWLEVERPNLVAAIRQASQHGWHRLTWQLAEVLWAFFKLRRYWGDWQETAELGLRAARQAGDSAATGRMLHDLGYVLRDRRRFPKATDLLEESLAVFRKLEDRFWEGRTLGTLGTAYRMQRHLDQAVVCYEQSLTIRREVGDRRGQAQALEALGNCYRQQQRFDEATACLTQGLAGYRELGDRWGEGRALGLLGSVSLEQERFDDAVALLEESLAITREVGNQYGEGLTLADVARASVGQRRLREADSYLRQSLAIFRALGDHYAVGQVLRNFGLIVEHVRGHKAARGYWQEAVAALAPLQVPDTARIQRWIDHPGLKKSWWSELEL